MPGVFRKLVSRGPESTACGALTILESTLNQECKDECKIKNSTYVIEILGKLIKSKTDYQFYKDMKPENKIKFKTEIAKALSEAKAFEYKYDEIESDRGECATENARYEYDLKSIDKILETALTNALTQLTSSNEDLKTLRKQETSTIPRNDDQTPSTPGLGQ